MGGRNLGRLAGDVFGFVLLFAEAPDAQRPSVPALRSHLLSLLDGFAKQPDLQRIPPEEVEEARFALVAWADETILRSDWSGREEWLREPLQLQLFRTNRAGDEFYEHLARLRPDQSHAREIYFLCLVHGFEGQYAGEAAGRADLIRQQFEFLRASGHALDVVAASPLAPPAYEVEIQLHRASGRRLWPVVVAWFGLVLGVGLALWITLQLFAGSVDLPPGV